MRTPIAKTASNHAPTRAGDIETLALPCNGASSVISDVHGPEIGGHARVATDGGASPFNVPVEIEAELELMTSPMVRATAI